MVLGGSESETKNRTEIKKVILPFMCLIMIFELLCYNYILNLRAVDG